MIYLDQAATSFPKPPQGAGGGFSAADGQQWAGGHELSLSASRLIFEARLEAARFGSSDPSRIAFTPMPRRV